MATTTLLKPTIHVEIRLKGACPVGQISREVCASVIDFLLESYAMVHVGQQISGYENILQAKLIAMIEIADYTGPDGTYHALEDVELDLQTYWLRADTDGDPRRRINQPGTEDEVPQARILHLPNAALKDEWDSLIYDDALPSQLLRYLTRMLCLMRQPDLNISTFNWNRLCLLHGPPGSGKSTLCRALAQKLSIRLSPSFSAAVLVEVDTNAMLSKYFGESGKLISSLFERIHAMAQSPSTLVCVVMDEVETIAGSREKATISGECNDGLRATNQLLTALDRIRTMPNILVLCTSNLVDAIDPAFLDRVDIKQLVPSPSPAAIYNIFRSCLNELIRANIIRSASYQDGADTTVTEQDSITRTADLPGDVVPATPPAKRRRCRLSPSSSPLSSPPQTTSPSPHPFQQPCTTSTPPPGFADPATAEMIPTFAAMSILHHDAPSSPARRVWALAQRCGGLSGRTLRRLPILGLAMYTWGGTLTVADGVTALGEAVDAEVGKGRGFQGQDGEE